MSESLFYSDLVVLTIEGYMEFVIGGYLNIKEPLFTLNGEIVSSGMGVYCVFITMVAVPFWFLKLACTDLETIQTEEFQTKWGGLFSGIKTSRKVHLMYFAIFCLRRLLFISGTFLLD